MKIWRNIVIAAAVMAAAVMAASVSGASAQQGKGKILVILSSETTLPLKDGKTFETGYYLNELVDPAMRFKDAGYELVFANPKGNTPQVATFLGHSCVENTYWYLSSTPELMGAACERLETRWRRSQ